MLKKKLCLIVIFLLMTISILCSAADNGWVVVYEDNTTTMLLDTSRVALVGKPENPYVSCWIKNNMKNESETCLLSHKYIQVNTWSSKTGEFIIYEGGQYIRTENHSDKGWKNSIPGSRLEIAIQNTLSWVVNNEEKVIKIIPD